MLNDYDGYENPAQPQPDPNRPPQLNKTVCGCYCGRGSVGVQEGNGENKDDDAASTLVASEGSDVGDNFPSSPNETAHDASSLTANGCVDMFRARMEMFIGTAESPQHVMGSLRAFPIEFLPDEEGTANSMRNEPGSDVHSVITMPENLPSRCISPGLVVAGAGTWIDDVPSEYHIPLEYHFLVRPLRLTPQHRYCRGLVASHLVLREEGAPGDGGEGFFVGESGVPDYFRHD